MRRLRVSWRCGCSLGQTGYNVRPLHSVLLASQMFSYTPFPVLKSRGPGEIFYPIFPPYIIRHLKILGLGTTFPFALKLVELLLGSETRNKVQNPMVFPAAAGPYFIRPSKWVQNVLAWMCKTIRSVITSKAISKITVQKPYSLTWHVVLHAMLFDFH